jgi:flagellar hook-basal body complex protein FliE
MTPIDPTLLTTGPEWSIGAPDVAPGTDAATGAAGAGDGGGGSFGSMLVDQIDKLEGLQNGAADAARSIADGTATDPSSAVVAVERARLAMQLASQLRTKGVEAFQDVFHTQV